MVIALAERARLERNGYGVTVVLLTSHAGREVVESVKSVVRYGYVIKTSGEFVLLQAVEMALELFHAQ